ncbi:MAG: hypothetical protein ACRCT1_05605 [Microcoleaceae cyanobacterium]|jgi:hypothetical protein
MISDIFVSIRNEDGIAMTSVEGVAFVAILKRDVTIIDRQKKTSPLPITYYLLPI